MHSYHVILISHVKSLPEPINNMLSCISLCSWLCHVDDDMYVNLKPLVTTLSHFDPRTEGVYFGRSGTTLEEPRQVRNDSHIGRPGTRYHFAVGGMYCLSRALLEEARPYLM